ncbi:MAG: hypothetical protein JWP13_492 [Candidatus Saccharibacteria bacterium]|nr:hypothetical protein [Candidatus Saccharibacteria bacterium]
MTQMLHQKSPAAETLLPIDPLQMWRLEKDSEGHPQVRSPIATIVGMAQLIRAAEAAEEAVYARSRWRGSTASDWERRRLATDALHRVAELGPERTVELVAEAVEGDPDVWGVSQDSLAGPVRGAAVLGGRAVLAVLGKDDILYAFPAEYSDFYIQTRPRGMGFDA